MSARPEASERTGLAHSVGPRTSRRLRIGIAALLFLLVFSSAVAASSGPLVNGDFETGDLSGWTTFLTPRGELSASVVPFDIDNDGTATNSARFVVGHTSSDAGYQGGGIFQIVPLSSGNLTITARIAMTPWGCNADGGVVTMLFDDVMADTHDFGESCDNANRYATLRADLSDIAAGNHEIRFVVTRRYFMSGNADLIDDVVLSGSALETSLVQGQGRFNTDGNGQVVFTLSHEQVSFDRVRGDHFSFTGEVESVTGQGAEATLTGSGSWNGHNGYTFEVSVLDMGGWGRLKDTISVVIFDPASSVVFTSVGPQVLKQGDISVTPAESG